ncbi:hypothetical protein FRC12_008040 [Ceratobasidium sp. 428]|nr:hypothetical protein FRC12_008040 [Ceratobasidium sp. 428]
MTFSDLIRTEPLKALLTIYEFGVVLVKLPVWVLFYARRANRPRKSWTLTKTIFVNFLRNVSDPAMRMGRFNGRNSTKEAVPKDCQDARFIWLEPVSPKLIDGQVKKFAEAAKVQSARIPAYGYGKWGAEPTELLLAGDNERIVMHLHGGGYIVRTLDASSMVSDYF